ncbi:hypothetical protein J8273_7168 [Carpediemonas membranifera]|uniref:Uncharacterized protein n=1 Tax=Carpediemonas membranifera TaxID=201153 RepID=A0A8J6AXM1_9EUKA|nr:hypothetical protein J8273_7168 [Carpediemonas membranifera]|eukprot:KAG9390903.1 hypothetical protein J8273_7168 [Carpediemonas membranifera]
MQTAGQVEVKETGCLGPAPETEARLNHSNWQRTMARAIRKKSTAKKARQKQIEHIEGALGKPAASGGEVPISKSQMLKQQTKRKKAYDKRITELRFMMYKLKKSDPYEKAERKKISQMIKQLTEESKVTVQETNKVADEVHALFEADLDLADNTENMVQLDGKSFNGLLDPKTGKVTM